MEKVFLITFFDKKTKMYGGTLHIAFKTKEDAMTYRNELLKTEEYNTFVVVGVELK